MTENKSDFHINGDERLAAHLRMYSKDMTEKVAKGMLQFGGDIMRKSVELVPKDFGELAARSFVEGPMETEDGSEYVVVVGYEKHGAKTGTENPDAEGNYYAVPVHEMTEVRHENGQAKFLEQPYLEAEAEYLEFMAEIAEEAKADGA